jgi:hypothetical protein
VLPNHRPAPHFLGDQDFSNFWSCAHFLSSSVELAPKPAFAPHSTLGAADSGLIFPVNTSILSVWQIDPA